MKPLSYELPDPLPWQALVGPLAAAEDSLARLDERLRTSPIREGWIARTHFADAAASLWLEGSLVHIADLVLHDAGMDVRAPSHDLVRAHAVLRARRRIAAADPDWALSRAGLDELCRRTAARDRAGEGASSSDEDPDEELLEEDDGAGLEGPNDPAVESALAELELAMMRSQSRLADPRLATEQGLIVYDVDWDETERLAEWRHVIVQTRDLPATLAAAIVAMAWDKIEPLQHKPWVGRLLTSALLRERGKTPAHLTCLNVGLRAVPFERRRGSDQARIVAMLDGVTAAAEAGRKDHDRWISAYQVLTHKLKGKRASSKLPALVDFVMSRPIVSASTVAEAIGVTQRAAQDLVAELGLREVTGRGRYRAWGVL